MWRKTLAETIKDHNISWDTNSREQRRRLRNIEGTTRINTHLGAEDWVDFAGADCIRESHELRKALSDKLLYPNAGELQEFLDGNINSRSGTVRDILYLNNLPDDLLVKSLGGRNPPDWEVIRRQRSLSGLRDYQEDLADQITTNLDKPRSEMLLSLPTGAGKTRVCLEGVLRWIDSSAVPKVAWWMVGTKELCKQASDSVARVWEDQIFRPSTQSSDLDLRLIRQWDSSRQIPRFPIPNDKHTIIVGTYQQVEERTDPNDPKAPVTQEWLNNTDVLIFDEAHLRVDSQCNIVDKAPNCKHRIGLTATPDRSNALRSQKIAQLYPNPLFPVKSMRIRSVDQIKDRLTSDGYLSVKVEEEYDVYSLLKKSGNEKLYSNTNRENNFGHMRALRDLVVNLVKADDRKSIIAYVTGIDEAKTVSLAINRKLRELNRNERSACVHSGLSPTDIEETLSDYRNGEICCLINVEMLVAGFDAPKTDCVILAKNISEEAHRLQMVGRGLRGVESKGTPDCLVVTLHP